MMTERIALSWLVSILFVTVPNPLDAAKFLVAGQEGVFQCVLDETGDRLVHSRKVCAEFPEVDPVE